MRGLETSAQELALAPIEKHSHRFAGWDSGRASVLPVPFKSECAVIVQRSRISGSNPEDQGSNPCRRANTFKSEECVRVDELKISGYHSSCF